MIKQKDNNVCVICIDIYNSDKRLLVVRMQHNSGICVSPVQPNAVQNLVSMLPFLLNATIFFRSLKPSDRQTLKLLSAQEVSLQIRPMKA